MVKPSSVVETKSARRQPMVWTTAWGSHRRVHFDLIVSRDPEVKERALLTIVSDVSMALAEAIDELHTYNSDFRAGLRRAVLYVLERARARQESVIFFNETLPGFTLMLFKKSETEVFPLGEKPDHPPVETPELAAALEVIRQNVQRTKNRVLVLESDDAIMVFFPVSDLKKNLKEMGFYYTA